MTTPRQALQIALRRDLSSFYRRCFATVSPGDRYSHNWHVDAMSHALAGVRGGARNLIVTVPPRSGKSLLASVALPAWLLGHDPSTRVICASYAEKLAIQFSIQCRAVMVSPWYREAFPGTALSPLKNTEGEFQTTRHGGRFATSVEGTLTGRGGDVVIIDDPMNAADADSEAMRERVKRWFDQSVSSRLNDKTRGSIVLLMQRLHVDDLAGHLLDGDGWEHLNLPAIAEVDKEIPLGPDPAGRRRVHHRRVGDLLHPQRETAEVLARMRTRLGSSGFSAQYQQDPVPAGGNTIDFAWFRRFDVRPPRRRYESVMQSWDTASKPGTSNDWSVCTTWLVQDETFYLLDLCRERLDMPSLRRRAVELFDRDRPDAVLIEDKGSGTALIQELNELGIPVLPVEPEGDKVSRANVPAVRIECGSVYIPNAAPWLHEFQREVSAFPKGRHDDQVDSVTQFLNSVVEQRRNEPRIRSFDD